MGLEYERLRRCLDSVRERTSFSPSVALVLGSGLGGYAGQMSVECEVKYGDIDGFPAPTAPGHAGRLIFGRVCGVPVVCMQGRVHYYEGYEMEDVVLPVRLMGLLGAGAVILTNAAGGIARGMRAGDLMLITDQIASFVPSPLRGANIGELGTRFPDMSQIYDADFIRIARRAAAGLGIDLREGTYIQMPGPQYESPAEVAMCRALGADAVGMSTACEAVAARHMGLRVMGISCISNLASGIAPSPLSHEEVQRSADEAAPRFAALVTEAIRQIGESLGR